MRPSASPATALSLALSASVLALPATAAAEMDAGPFAEGSIRISAIFGVANQIDNTAFILGAGAGYYIVDGLELGLEGEYWINSEPSVSKVSPNARYVLWFVPVLKPYVGTFYRHLFVGAPKDDMDSLGGRAGAFWVSGGGSYFGGGVVHEIYVKGCEVSDCSETYPEIMLSFSF
jgi:hypothetical protein